MNYCTFFFLAFFSVFKTFAGEIGTPLNLVSPPETETSYTITLLWDKPANAGNVAGYVIYRGNHRVGTSKKANYTVNGLSPAVSYTFRVRAIDAAGNLSAASQVLTVKTKPAGKRLNIQAFGAHGDSVFDNTKAIQHAINACPSGGTVIIPAGTFISGAIYLKSNMTLLIQRNGVLKATLDVSGYLPVVPSRFEGWELETYASLINVGNLDHQRPLSTSNVSIRGEGKIVGGGAALAEAMIKGRGIRSRGRLICIVNARNINIQGLQLEDAHCWTLHYIYSQNVSCHDLSITSTVLNGDGIDPDSSSDSYIFNCTFSTGDDCIAIKSGKNPEGNQINIPTRNIRISDCNFVKGLSLAIGSEMSGGVENVLITDCEIGNLNSGLQIKSRKDRGGYVRNVTVKDCSLYRINLETTISYNSDGEAAPALPKFENIRFINLDMTRAVSLKKPVIAVDGFPDKQHYTENVFFDHIKIPANSKITLNYCRNIRFANLITVGDGLPEYKITNSEDIVR
jgi:exo-poly-alpha-galacturonosidase